MAAMKTRIFVILISAALAGLQWPELAEAQLPLPVPRPTAPPAEDTAAAAPSEPSIPDAFKSPAATMQTFLQAMANTQKSPQTWEQALDCIDLNEQAAVDDPRIYARQLYAILNRIERINTDLLPNADQVQANAISRYLYFPQPLAHSEVLEELGAPPVGRIELTYTDGGWKFSEQTAKTLGKLHQQFLDAGVSLKAGTDILTFGDRIRKMLPSHLVNEHFLTLETWQWLALFIIIVVGLVIDVSFRLAVRSIARKLITKEGGTADRQVMARSARPFGILAGAVVWGLLLPYIDLPPLPHKILHGAAIVVAILSGIMAAWRLTDLVAEILIARAARTEGKFDDVLYPLLRKATKIFIFIMGTIYIAGALNVLDDIWPVLASLGLGSLAFAFAAKDTVENFFGSIAVLTDRPFHVGDWVATGDTEGIVEEIGFRSTRIRTFYNSLVTVPNANLVRAVVDNFGQRKYRRWKTYIGVQYDTTPDQIIAFTEGIRELIRMHPYTRKDYFIVRLNEFANSSLNILLYVFHEVPDWSTELRERERLFLDILRLADQLGVQFAFPTQTIHLFKEEHTDHQVRHDVPQATAEQSAVIDGIRKAQQLVQNQPWTRETPGPVEFKSTGPTSIDIDPATGQPLAPEDKTQIENTTSGG